jgi:RiboL-PSP-HEPN
MTPPFVGLDPRLEARILQVLAAKGFDRTAARVHRLIDAHGVLHGGGRGRPRQQAADVLRGALVLIVAALDAFVIDAFVEAIPPLARSGRLGPAAHNLVDAKGYLHVISSADPAEEFARIAALKFATKTFQKSGAIESHLRENLDYALDWGAVATGLGLGTGNDAKKELDGYVTRRNEIAHAGDVPPGAKRATPINRQHVLRCVKVIEATVNVINVGLDAHI